MSDVNILAFSGSLRAASQNTALIRAAAELAPAGVSVSLYDYSDVPLYNDDLEVPESVIRLKDAITAADGLLMAVPEYNYSMPGVLKNAIDWASRPAYNSPFRHKPVAVMSASVSAAGGVRGLQHTKTILLGMVASVFPWPEYFLPSSHQKFTDGRLTDPVDRERLGLMMEGFAAWIEKQR